MHPKPDPVEPGHESVWDYPRPPRLEPVTSTLSVHHQGTKIAETNAGYRVLETSHPPVYYFPPGDCDLNVLELVGGSTFCEFKGSARYFNLKLPHQPQVDNVAWCYPTTDGVFGPIAGYLAFYARLLDQCRVGDMVAKPQEGAFYGGWITPDLAGPFKGGPGTMGW
ncbi:MAG: DUF427 domain-containing protein [Planctomycetota bacterium]